MAAPNLGAGEDGEVAAPTHSSTQKAASHLVRRGRIITCGADHVDGGLRLGLTEAEAGAEAEAEAEAEAKAEAEAEAAAEAAAEANAEANAEAAAEAD